MHFESLSISGAYLLRQEVFTDARGSFSRQFCQREMEAAGIAMEIRQCNITHNPRRWTLRGMHYQSDPHPESKIVSCFSGAFYDVIVDLRPESPTYLEWTAAELRAGDGKSLYIPPYVAHGFQTLVDDTTIFYQLGEFFYPEDYAGVRFNDPKINVTWPNSSDIIINERDANYPLL